METKKEIESVTMLRGIASLAVCFMHFTGTTNSTFLKEIGQYGGLGVFLFFNISGFIIPYAMKKSNYKVKDFFRFILKRIIRLDPPYIISILGIFLLSILAQLSKFHSVETVNLFSTNTFYHLFYLVDFVKGKWLNPVFWTLAIELQFYLLIALIFPLFNLNKIYFKLFAFCVFSILPFVLPYDALISNYLLMFLAGILLFEYYEGKISPTNYNLLLSIILGLCFLKHGLNATFCPLIAIVFVLYIKKSFKILLFLGKISYSLYLIHTPIGTDGFINFIQNYVTDDTYRIVLMFVSFPIIIFCAWLFYKLVEEPSLKYSKKILFR